MWRKSWGIRFNRSNYQFVLDAQKEIAARFIPSGCFFLINPKEQSPLPRATVLVIILACWFENVNGELCTFYRENNVKIIHDTFHANVKFVHIMLRHFLIERNIK